MSTDRGNLCILPYSKYQTLEFVVAPAHPGEIVVLLGNFGRSSCDWLRIEFSLCNSADHSALALIPIFDNLPLADANQ